MVTLIYDKLTESFTFSFVFMDVARIKFKIVQQIHDIFFLKHMRSNYLFTYVKKKIEGAGYNTFYLFNLITNY